MTEIRVAVLEAAFRLLYGPLVFLHEPLGRFLWGNAWAARRLHLIEYVQPDDCIVDVGCGEGHLLVELTRRGLSAAGVEPSASMRRRSLKKELNVRPGTARAVPWPDSSFDVVVATYPGTWIFDASVWTEFRRVTVTNGRVVVLLGGDYRKGQLSRLRSAMIRWLYPRESTYNWPPHVTTLEDEWGMYYVLYCELN